MGIKQQKRNNQAMGVDNGGKKMSKKELAMRNLAEEVRQILGKHKIKPFNRSELYGK